MLNNDISTQLKNIENKALGIQAGLKQFRIPPVSPEKVPEDDLSRTLTDLTGQVSTALKGIGPMETEQKTIMEKLAERRKLAIEAAETQKGLIKSEAETALEEAETLGKSELISHTEAQRGFATNTAAVRQLEDTSRKRIKEIQKARDELLMKAELGKAGQLDDLEIQELTLVTQARQNWLKNLFGVISGVTALAEFETPQQKRQRELQTETQKSVINLSVKAPDVDISPDDDLETALGKYRNSSTYKNDIVKSELELNKLRADIAKTNAEAAKARADTQGLEIDLSDPSTALFSRAIQFLTPGATADQRKDIIRTYQSIMKSGDLEQGKEYIKKVARSTVSGEEQKSAIKRNQLLQQIRAIKTAFETYVEDGGDTGLFIGTIESIKRRLGRTGNTDLVKIGSSIITAMQNLRVDITGAAFGENEAKEYANLFPSFSNQMNINEALLDAIENSIQRFDDSFYSSMIGETNFENLFGRTSDILGTSSGRTLTSSSSRVGEDLSDNLFGSFFQRLLGQ